MTQASFHPVDDVDQEKNNGDEGDCDYSGDYNHDHYHAKEQEPGPSLGLGPPSSPREPPSQWCLKIHSICKIRLW